MFVVVVVVVAVVVVCFVCVVLDAAAANAVEGIFACSLHARFSAPVPNACERLPASAAPTRISRLAACCRNRRMLGSRDSRDDKPPHPASARNGLPVSSSAAPKKTLPFCNRRSTTSSFAATPAMTTPTAMSPATPPPAPV